MFQNVLRSYIASRLCSDGWSETDSKGKNLRHVLAFLGVNR